MLQDSQTRLEKCSNMLTKMYTAEMCHYVTLDRLYIYLHDAKRLVFEAAIFAQFKACLQNDLYDLICTLKELNISISHYISMGFRV